MPFEPFEDTRQELLEDALGLSLDEALVVPLVSLEPLERFESFESLDDALSDAFRSAVSSAKAAGGTPLLLLRIACTGSSACNFQPRSERRELPLVNPVTLGVLLLR